MVTFEPNYLPEQSTYRYTHEYKVEPGGSVYIWKDKKGQLWWSKDKRTWNLVPKR